MIVDFVCFLGWHAMTGKKYLVQPGRPVQKSCGFNTPEIRDSRDVVE